MCLLFIYHNINLESREVIYSYLESHIPLDDIWDKKGEAAGWLREYYDGVKNCVENTAQSVDPE